MWRKLAVQPIRAWEMGLPCLTTTTVFVDPKVNLTFVPGRRLARQLRPYVERAPVCISQRALDARRKRVDPSVKGGSRKPRQIAAVIRAPASTLSFQLSGSMTLLEPMWLGICRFSALSNPKGGGRLPYLWPAVERPRPRGLVSAHRWLFILPQSRAFASGAPLDIHFRWEACAVVGSAKWLHGWASAGTATSSRQAASSH